MIKIRGDYLEGGGSLVRVAVALSATTGQPIKIERIRKGRSNPGLRAQHVEAINAVAKLCDAEMTGIEVGSNSIAFSPKKMKCGEITVRIPTAGSVGLLLQSFLIASVNVGASLHIEGGATNGKWAAPALYMKNVLLPILSKFGYSGSIEIERYGYYPKGGAKINVRKEPAVLKPTELLEKGKPIRIGGLSHASSYLEKSKVADRQKKASIHVLKSAGIPIDIEKKYVDVLNPGSAVDLFAVFENTVVGGDALGERGKKAEEVGKEAAERLLSNMENAAAVDENAEDMVIPYMALAAEGGESKIRVPKLTKHTQTNIWVVEQFLPVKFKYDKVNKIISSRYS